MYRHPVELDLFVEKTVLSSLHCKVTFDINQGTEYAMDLFLNGLLFHRSISILTPIPHSYYSSFIRFDN